MKKKSLALVGLLSLFLINFVSAQFYDYYNNFSLSNFLSGIDQSTILLSILFIICFALIYFSTSKMFKENKAISGVISLALSLLIVYEINQNFNIQNFFYGFGIADTTLYTIGFLLFTAFAIFLIAKMKLAGLVIIGAILSLVCVLGNAFGIFFWIGNILWIGGILISVLTKKKGPPKR